MTRLRLILRNLRYFAGVNVALGVGMVVATAVLTGALMVGDSVRESLAQLTRDRLGKIDHAMIARRFFDQELLDRLEADPAIANRFGMAPAVLVQGSATNESTGSGAGAVQVGAIGRDWAKVERGHTILNDATAQALGVHAGEGVLISVPAKPDEPRDAALSRRSREDTLANLRADVAEVHPASDMLGLFNPNGGQRVPQNAWVNLSELQEQIELRGQVNAILAHDLSGGQNGAGADLLNRRLRDVVRLGDFGLDLSDDPTTGETALTSRTTYLDSPAVAAAEAVAKANGIPLRHVTVNLINSVRLSGPEPMGSHTPSPGTPGEGRGEGLLSPPQTGPSPRPSPRSTGARGQKGIASADVTPATQPASTESTEDPSEVHYAVAAGVSDFPGGDLPPDGVAINQWTADQLGAKVGDRIRLAFYARQPSGDLVEIRTDSAGFPRGLRVERVLPLAGLGADPRLTPEYHGLTDAESMADWNPPEGVVIDKKLVTRRDEDYWHTYKAAPKLFLNYATAQKLWGGSVPQVTSLRVPADRVKEFGQKLLAALDPAAMGLSFQPIMAQQLAASGGSTDFAGLFFGFSFFLIVAAVLLVAMLFRLSVEQRARQLGLLAAVGFGPWGLRRMALAEGLLVACAGAAIGLPAAVGYTWVMMYGLRTWWVGAVGTTSLRLHVEPMTLVYGFAASVFVAMLAILWAAWRVGRTSAATLLAGGWGGGGAGRRGGRVLRGAGILFILLALATFLYAGVSGGQAAETFLSGGFALLVGCLCWIGGTLRPGVRAPSGAVGVLNLRRLGVRNAARRPARSILAVALVALASFTLITVAAFRQGEPGDTGDVRSGAGGYRLIMTAGVPLLGDLNTPQGRHILGMTDADDTLWAGTRFVALRRRVGQDISCLNLTRPTTPAILGVPPDLSRVAGPADAYRFTFAQTGGAADPWTLLDRPEPDGAIPVIADDATAQYILHLSVGQTLDVPGDAGEPVRLRLVATLANSIFQSELLMGESNFRRLFPRVDGFGVVLVDCPRDKQQPVRQALNTQLADYAADAQPTSYRLAQYLTIQNTYLSTFQALGALGLMLGTIGLSVVLVRTVIERRAELALLASLGFRRIDRIRLVLFENAFLLILGVGVGSVCAAIGILPAVRQSGQGINGWSLAATLLGVLAVGLAASGVAVLLSGAHASPADLRRE